MLTCFRIERVQDNRLGGWLALQLGLNVGESKIESLRARKRGNKREGKSPFQTDNLARLYCSRHM